MTRFIFLDAFLGAISDEFASAAWKHRGAFGETMIAKFANIFGRESHREWSRFGDAVHVGILLSGHFCKLKPLSSLLMSATQYVRLDLFILEEQLFEFAEINNSAQQELMQLQALMNEQRDSTTTFASAGKNNDWQQLFLFPL